MAIPTNPTKFKQSYSNSITSYGAFNRWYEYYSSMAFTNAHKDYNIIRSMSRAGTPTDNPKMESINGWIKDEIENDFDINSYPSFDDFIKVYIHYFNNERLAYSLNYKTPIQYKTELGF